MPTEKEKAALKCAKFLYAKYGYVVVCFLPTVKEKFPVGKKIYGYANNAFSHHVLTVTAQTKKADFNKQVKTLFEAKFISYIPNDSNIEGCRFFRCTLIDQTPPLDDEIPLLDDDIPF